MSARDPSQAIATATSKPEPLDSIDDIDDAIRKLVEQQESIQLRLEGLYEARHGLNPSREVDMLKHKLRLLESLVDYHGTFCCFANCFDAIQLSWRCTNSV